ncbi:MAG: HypC/HybG/HupF family hydrogenase formation chaperone [Trueperaceae bacterium]|nr:MAG: HypC/HybG/HupF family hydrogenase formation chaperone [Trueperaceae bacterium]
MCLAIPGRIAEFIDEGHYAVVDVSGVRRRVNVDLLREDGLEQGDWVLIHVGFAMSKISSQDAEEQMRLLTLMGEAEGALEEVRGYGTLEGPEDGA